MGSGHYFPFSSFAPTFAAWVFMSLDLQLESPLVNILCFNYPSVIIFCKVSAHLGGRLFRLQEGLVGTPAKEQFSSPWRKRRTGSEVCFLKEENNSKSTILLSHSIWEKRVWSSERHIQERQLCEERALRVLYCRESHRCQRIKSSPENNLLIWALSSHLQRPPFWGKVPFLLLLHPLRQRMWLWRARRGWRWTSEEDTWHRL